RLDVRQGRDAARGDHRYRDAARQLCGALDVDTLQQPVAVDVGEDDDRGAGILELARQIERGDVAGLGPALDRDLAALGVDADRDLARELAARLFHQRGILQRHGAEDDARDAASEPVLDLRQVTDAAAELYRNLDALEDGLDRRRIHRLAGERAVEVHEMQPFRTHVREAAR